MSSSGLPEVSEAVDNPRWRSLTEPAEVAGALADVYRHRGSASYEENVSQSAHARQAGALALANDADPATVVAAFLHDIGHLLMSETTVTATDRPDGQLERDWHHEEVGARFLANWFGNEVLTPVRLHVPAKRYLCAVEPTYHDGLSSSSVRSLVVQGGPMSPAEVASFESVAHHEAAVQLRRWDDQAKVVGAEAPTIEFFEGAIEALLSEHRS